MRPRSIFRPPGSLRGSSACPRSPRSQPTSPGPGTSSMPKGWCSAASPPRWPRILRGKHKPIYAPHCDTGDHVIIVNADKIVLTAGKAEKKLVYRHSGYPGGLQHPDVRQPARGQADRCGPQVGARHAPEEPARSPDAQEAEGVHGPEPSPRRAEPPAARHRARPQVIGVPLPKPPATVKNAPLVMTTGRRKGAVARVWLRPGNGTITINGRDAHRLLPEPDAPPAARRAAARERDGRRLRRARHDRRRRHHGPGGRAAPRHRPRARRARRGDAADR